jgi:hypothetical protein
MQEIAHPVGTNGKCSMTLERELATFQAKLPELLATDTGKFVLIHGEDVIGVWDTEGEALDAGYDRFLGQAFLVKQIVADEQTVFLP